MSQFMLYIWFFNFFFYLLLYSLAFLSLQFVLREYTLPLVFKIDILVFIIIMTLPITFNNVLSLHLNLPTLNNKFWHLAVKKIKLIEHLASVDSCCSDPPTAPTLLSPCSHINTLSKYCNATISLALQGPKRSVWTCCFSTGELAFQFPCWTICRLWITRKKWQLHNKSTSCKDLWDLLP